MGAFCPLWQQWIRDGKEHLIAAILSCFYVRRGLTQKEGSIDRLDVRSLSICHWYPSIPASKKLALEGAGLSFRTPRGHTAQFKQMT